MRSEVDATNGRGSLGTWGHNPKLLLGLLCHHLVVLSRGQPLLIGVLSHQSFTSLPEEVVGRNLANARVHRRILQGLSGHTIASLLRRIDLPGQDRLHSLSARVLKVLWSLLTVPRLRLRRFGGLLLIAIGLSLPFGAWLILCGLGGFALGGHLLWLIWTDRPLLWCLSKRLEQPDLGGEGCPSVTRG